MLITHVCLIKRKQSYPFISSFYTEWVSAHFVSWNSQFHFFDKWEKGESHSSLNTDWFRWDLIVCFYRYLRHFSIHQRFCTCWLLTVITVSSQPCFWFIWQWFPVALLWLLLCGHFKALFQRGAGSGNSLYSDDSLISCFLAFVVFTNRDVCPDSH